MHYIISALLIVFSVFLSGCLSEEEKQVRRDNAFDISGTYQTEEDSEVQLSFKITNRTGKHDILVALTRTSPLTRSEEGLLSKVKTEYDIAEDIFTMPAKITLERDKYLDLFEGGSNISDNFGKTSRFYVCDDNPSEYGSNKADKKNIRIQISYCFSGTIKKESKNLVEGKLSLGAYSYSYDTTTNERHFKSEGGEIVDLNYKAKITSSN